MAHSTDGSGWTRLGVTKDNPIHSNEPILMFAYEDSRSVYAFIYEWVLRQGFMLLPERLDKPERADMEFDVISVINDEEQMEKAEEVMTPLVPEDKNRIANFLHEIRKRKNT